MKYLLSILSILLLINTRLIASTGTVPNNIWMSSYSGTANLDDVTNSVSAINDGSIFATGYEMTSTSPYIVTRGWIQRLTSSGTVAWTTTFSSNTKVEGRSISVSTVNNGAYIGGTIGNRGIIRKYNLSGNLVWGTTVQLGGQSAVNSVHVLSTGIYVTGYYLESSTVTDFKAFFIKYNDSGSVIWYSTYNASSKQDIGTAIKAKSTVIYACGSSQNKAVTWKFNVNGTLISTQTTGGSGINPDSCLGLDIDESLAIYTVGYKETTFPFPNLQKSYVQKIGSDGLLRWTTSYSNGIILNKGGYDRAKSIAVISSTVYVAGVESSTNTKQDVNIRLFDTNGNLNWTTSYFLLNAYVSDAANSIVTSSNNFIVGGSVSVSTKSVYSSDVTTSTPRGTDGFIRKY